MLTYRNQVPVALCLVLFAPSFLSAQEDISKQQVPLEYRTILQRLTLGDIDTAQALLAKHPQAIKQGIEAGAHPLAEVCNATEDASRRSPQAVQALQLLLQHGASGDEPDVLYRLLQTRRLEEAALLLKKSTKADVGGSYLAQAIWAGADQALLEKMLELEADPNLRDKLLEEVPLHVAVRTKNTKAAKLLLEHDAHVNATDDKGQTVLHEALRQHAEPALVELLLEHDADPNLVDRSGISPVALAVHHAQARRVLELLAARQARPSPAALIVLGQDEKLAESITNRKAANQTEPIRQMPLLEVAAMHGNASAAELLLKQGAQVDGVVHHRPLHMAVLFKQVEVARVLLQHQADPNTQGTNNLTPLHEAARAGRSQLVKLLLASGADPQATTGKDSFVEIRWQPLHFAVQGGHHDVARQLLKASALPADETVLKYLQFLAESNQDEKMLKLLRNAD